MTAFGMIPNRQSMDEQASGVIGRSAVGPATRLMPAPEGIAPRTLVPQGRVIKKLWGLLPKPPAAPAVNPFKRLIAPIMADGPVKGESIIVPSLIQSQPTFVVPQVAAPVMQVAKPAPGVQIQTATIQGPGTPSLKPAVPTSEPRPTAQETPDTAYQPKGPGFFDQELIPGVKNLYLAAATGGLLLLMVMWKRK